MPRWDAGLPSAKGEVARATFFTIGHSRHPLEEFIEILSANGVELLIDVRTVHGSRHNPQFGGEALAASMPAAGIEYRQMKDLGGLRHTPADLAAQPINGVWRNKSFRNYADYMQTKQFTDAIAELIGAAAKQGVVIMCAEAVPWRCHRLLIGDALLVPAGGKAPGNQRRRRLSPVTSSSPAKRGTATMEG